MNEKKELLNMLKEMWQKGNSPLHRIYSSWEELEANVEIRTEPTTQKHKFQPCPNCGAKQKITKHIWLSGDSDCSLSLPFVVD